MRQIALPCLWVLAACEPGTDSISLGTNSADLVEVEWSGTVPLAGTVEIGANEHVSVLPGTRVEIASGGKLLILGSLTAEGTADAPVVFDAPDGWSGIELHGALVGTYLEIAGARGPIVMRAGVLDLVDSVLDLRAPNLSPDCTSISGGAVTLDHVRITGCHCPIHINAASSATMTNSVFDGAAVPLMLANVTGTFTGNDIVGTPGMMDVGSGIDAEIAGNYWGGGAPTLQTADPTQFIGAENWSPTPIAGAGPR